MVSWRLPRSLSGKANMHYERRHPGSVRVSRRSLTGAVEGLEDRALLASTAGITPPNVQGLIFQAFHGKNTAPAVIRAFESALQTQLTNGQLADLNAGTVVPDDFAAEVAGFVSTYQAAADQQLSPRFPNVDNIIKLQGTKLESEINALAAQSDAGVIDDTTFGTQAAAAINGLTGGPLYALHTPPSGYVTATKTLETNLNNLASSLGTTATNPLDVTTVQTVAAADVQAYSDATSASLSVSHPNINAQVQSAVTTLQTAITNLSTATDPQTALTSAVTAFDKTVLDGTGIFGPFGLVNQNVRRF
jgi:hypothetical protein